MLLKDVEHNEVSNWIREQICDLEYGEDVADKVANVSASFTRQVLMEMSYEDIASVLTKAKIDESNAIAVAMGLFNRIQNGIAQPQPVQSDVPENVKAFARALDDAELEGQILKTAAGSFKLEQDSEIWNETKFYVRDCYKEIADIMLKNKPHRTLKSAPEQALYIMDADIDVEHGVSCQSLWITSARRPETPASNAEHFKKAERFSGQFFMPPWELEEMLNAEVKALHELNDKVVMERFGIFGGTA
ncbi:unnamed protein product, partial [Symbiodinium sp. KB8]